MPRFDVIINLFLSINDEIKDYHFNEKDFFKKRVARNYHLPIVKEYYATLLYK